MNRKVLGSIAGMMAFGFQVATAAAAPNAPPRQVCIWHGSNGERVTITVDGKIILDKVLASHTKFSPDVGCWIIPNNSKDQSIMKVAWGHYREKFRIDWKNGPRLTVGFQQASKLFYGQDDGKAGFE